MLKRFVLWLIRKYLDDRQVVDAIIANWATADKGDYLVETLALTYKEDNWLRRRLIVNNFFDATRHDHKNFDITLYQMISRLVSKGRTALEANTLAKVLIVDATARPETVNNFVKHNAWLTNIVKSHLPNESTTDIQLIVSLLRKRVE